MSQQVRARSPHAGLEARSLEIDGADQRRARTRRRARRLRNSVALLSAFGALAFPLLSVTHTHDLAPWVGFKVVGKWEYGPPGTMFVATVDKFRLRANSGSLLDVNRTVLKAGIYRGAILLNGVEPQADAPLAEGDEITVRNGKDHVEPLVREVVHIPPGRPGNPEFYLGTTPGDQIIEKGKLSGQIVSSIFRPTGSGTRPNSVALTFDDGPWPGQSLQVLGILKKYKIKATFFVVGYLAERYPDIVRAEIAAGMEIGDHSWDHPTSPAFATLPPAKISDEIAKTRTTLGKYGVHAVIFRPPGGSWSPEVVTIAGRYQMRVVIWSVDPKDWQRPTAAEIVKRVLSQVRPGSIILLHDGGGDRSATLAALPQIIKGIQKMGLGFSTLDQ